MRMRWLVAVWALLAPLLVSAQTLKIATLAPDGSIWMKELRATAAQVQQATGNRVQFKFYPGGVMGNDTVVLRKVRLGQLQGGMLSGSELSLVYKDAQVYSLPFLFDSAAAVDRVRARVDPLLVEGFRRQGLQVLGVSGVGFAYLMSTHPIRSRDDLKSSKVWVPPNDEIGKEIFDQGGVSPIPLPLSDVFTSLQTGLIDTVVNTPSGAVALQWHGRLRHMVDLPLTYVVGYLVVDGKAWAKVAPADQQTVLGAFAAAAKRIDAANRAGNEAALQAMRRQGLVISKPTPIEVGRWHEIGAATSRRLAARGAFTPEVMAAIRRALGTPSASR